MAVTKEFIKKLAEDKEFADSLKASSKEEVLANIKKAGYEVSEKELDSLTKAAEGELTDEDLAGAAGGMFGNMDSYARTIPRLDIPLLVVPKPWNI